MDVYFSVLFFIILVCLLSNGKGDGKWPLGISILAIYLMISFQAGWGGDWLAYNFDFDRFHGMSLKELIEDESHGEIGYKFVISLLPSYVSVKFVFSAWYCLGLYVLFYSFIPRKWWPLGFFFLFINRPLLMGGLCAIGRTGFAAASFIIGLYFLAKGQRWKYAIILLIGSLFHISALFFLPLMFVPSKQGKLDALVGIAIFMAIFLVFYLFPSSWANAVESIIASTDTFESYEVYLEYETTSRQLISAVRVFSFFWIYELFVYIKKADYSRQDYLMMYMALIQIAFSFLPSVGLSGRFYYYINYAFFAGMMVLLEKEKNQALRLAIIVSLIFVFGKQFLTFYRTDYFAEHWLHYHTFWNY